MKICLTIPGFMPHGGIRVILEWANGLSRLGHKITLLSNEDGKPKWFNLNKNVKISTDILSTLAWSEILVICSPHRVDLQRHPNKPKNIFIFMQMLEHMFNPHNRAWVQQCNAFYMTPYPLISISQWNIDYIKRLGRKGVIHYIGNGINQKDFPIKQCKKKGNVVLVEGWELTNPSKDSNLIAHEVSRRLKSEGFTILAYSQLENKTNPDIPDEYYRLPSLSKINELYERATILLKASHFDARSTSPIEAMTKGCIPVRAIDKGDDDLTHLVNSYRCGYNVDELYAGAKEVLTNKPLRLALEKNCLEYVRNNTWAHHIGVIEGILIQCQTDSNAAS